MQNKFTSSLKFIQNEQSEILDVLLHGGAGGMNQTLMVKVFDACVAQGHSVVSFNFSFFERGDEHSSGPELVEEITTLKDVLNYCDSNKYKKIRLIGKSLGGIIVSKFLSELTKNKQEKFSVIIFGYVTGEVSLNNFYGKISIIQGGKDKYGNLEIVKNDLKKAVSKNIYFYQVPNGDHSYRNEFKEPIYEDVAIDQFNKIRVV